MNDNWEGVCGELALQGWRLETTTKGHLKAFPPDGVSPMVTFAVSSNDHRAFQNAVSQLRKSGFAWPPTAKKGKPVAQLPEAPIMLVHNVPLPIDLIEEVQQPKQAPAAPATEQDLDALFARLRDAKRYKVLADQHVEDMRREAEEAQARLRGALAEQAKAGGDLAGCKAAFDRVFAEVA